MTYPPNPIEVIHETSVMNNSSCSFLLERPTELGLTYCRASIVIGTALARNFATSLFTVQLLLSYRKTSLVIGSCRMLWNNYPISGRWYSIVINFLPDFSLWVFVPIQFLLRFPSSPCRETKIKYMT